MLGGVAIYIAISVSALEGIAYGDGLPKFSDYPARQKFTGTPTKPQFRYGEIFRDSVTFDAEQGPNFAGRYTLATWTCALDAARR